MLLFESGRTLFLQHNLDLAGHDLPWDAIGRLTALQELSLWVRLDLLPSKYNSGRMFVLAGC